MSSPQKEREVVLDIEGMTCASCAARVEKKLNRLAGVTATVNYATEKAKVTFGGEVTPEVIVATVESTGYTAALPHPKARRGAVNDEAGADLRSDPVKLPGGITAFAGHLLGSNHAVTGQPADDVLDP